MVMNERAWCFLLYATVWTIWQFRNLLVFEGKDPNLEQAADMVKFRIAWWFKHLNRGSKDSVAALYRNLDCLCMDYKRVKRKSIADWIPPMLDSLKFNVDGSSRGKPSPAGIGGVLRDSNGKVLYLFSVFLGIFDSNVAELFAIKKAVDLCLSNPFLRNRDIMVVSDSKVVVSWVNSTDFGNVDHINTIYDIQSMLKVRGDIQVVFDSRIYNTFADSLAKMGSDNRGDFLVWSEC